MKHREYILIILLFTGFILSGIIFNQKIESEDKSNQEIQALLLENQKQVSEIQALNIKNELLNITLKSSESYLSQSRSNAYDLQRQLDQSKKDYAELRTEYYATRVKNNQLNSTIQDLQIKNSYNLGNSLSAFYDMVRQENGLSGGYSDAVKTQFMASLAEHDLGINKWSNIETKFFETTNLHSHILGKNNLDIFVEQCNLSEGDSASKKIEIILDTVNGFISYESDIDDIYRSPIEVLDLKSGDCDDYSILVAAVFERVGLDSAVIIVKNIHSGDYHAQVLVHLEKVDFGYWKWSDLTEYGLKKGTWIHIEPQRTIQGQGDHDMDDWKILAAHEIDNIPTN